MIFAPVFGFYAIVLGPSGFLSRLHAGWLRLAFVSSCCLLIIFSVFQRIYLSAIYEGITFVYYLAVSVVCSRALQICFIDLYIAHVERIRWTRGWDGLCTSLYITEDNMMDLFDD